MKFEEFKENVMNNIKDYLPQEYADAVVEPQEIKAISKTYLGLTVRKNSDIVVPAINLEQFFRQYQENTQIGFKAIMEQISNKVQQSVEAPKMELFSQYEKAKEQLFVRLCNRDKNLDMLEKIPHTIYGDLAMTYHIKVRKEVDEIHSVMIDNRQLQNYGVEKEQLHQDALENSPNVFAPKIYNMIDLVEKQYRSYFQELDMPEEAIESLVKGLTHMFSDYPLFVVTNDMESQGAGTLFYSGLMDEVGEILGGDYFILPSSIHEIIVCLDDGLKDYHDLEQIVSGANTSVVAEKEILSDAVYHYDIKDRVFERIEDFEERKEQKEQLFGKKVDKSLPETKHSDTERRNDLSL